VEPWFQCSICSMKFKQKYNMIVHRRRHRFWIQVSLYWHQFQIVSQLWTVGVRISCFVFKMWNFLSTLNPIYINVHYKIKFICGLWKTFSHDYIVLLHVVLCTFWLFVLTYFNGFF
jgi:hypothetical protein